MRWPGSASAYGIFVVDLESGRRRVLSGCTSHACERIAGRGPMLHGGKLALDPNGCRMLVAHENTVYAVDLASGDRSIVTR
jgi:hypothetical protein